MVRLAITGSRLRFSHHSQTRRSNVYGLKGVFSGFQGEARCVFKLYVKLASPVQLEVLYTAPMLLSIGDLARQTHETVKTLRYWSDKRLLRAERGENGYRYFPAEMVQRVTFIRSAQAMGFSLNDIRAILELRQKRCHPL